MLQILDKLNMYADIIQYIIIGIALIGISIYFYLRHTGFKFSKKNKEVDYSEVTRKHAADFVQLEDIKNNMYINDNYTYFTAGIRCIGFDYKTAHNHEKVRVQKNYIEFFNMLEKPIQYFIQCRNIDMDRSINRYKETQVEVQGQIDNLALELDNLKESLDDIKAQDEIDIKLLEKIEEKIKKTSRSLENTKWQFDHLEHQIAYSKAISSPEQEPQRDEFYFFSYTHNKYDFTVDLSKEEIIDRAARELMSKANSTISVLKRCNVRATILTSNELAEIERRCYNPKSADTHKFRDILKSNFFELITTTDSFQKAKNEVLADEIIEGLERGAVENG